MKTNRRITLALLLAGLALLVAAPASLADYGNTAQYQIEFSANNVGGVPGDGLWLWIELDNNGTGTSGSGDYTGSVCIHQGADGVNSAYPQAGDVSWTDNGTDLTITGIVVKLRTGKQVPVTLKVPDSLGHYSGPTSDYLIPNFIGGTSQLQVAP